jgi:GT2 family glycosyltransferase
MESKELTIVIVTFKSDEKIINCLKSISNNTPVIVVENSDNKDFKTKVENIFTNVNCILVGENKGYSTANNIGLKSVKTKYALVLNPDTILDKDAIKNFFNTKEQVKDFWLIGPANNQIVHFNENDSNLKEVNNLKGFAIFLNLSKFKQDYFDENFFLFFEEIDLCTRVKKNKGKIYLDKQIYIKHDGASSVNKENKLDLEKTRNWHWMWSTFYYQKKYKGFLLALIIISPKLFSAIFKTLFYFIIINNKKREIYFCRLSGLLNSIIGKKAWYRPSID